MSTVVKESKILTSIPETATALPVASSTAAPNADARPQPVALEVAVTVNGARTVAGSDKREPFSESTKTVLIFGHGAVVRLSSAVAPGQLLFLTNEKTKKEVVCQVVKSKNYHNVSGYVELEFTEPVAGFWGMRFAAAAPAQSLPAASAPTATATKIPSGSSAVETTQPTTTSAGFTEKKSPISTSPRATVSSEAIPAPSTSQPPVQPKQVSVSKPAAQSSVAQDHAPAVSIPSGSEKRSNVVEISKSKSTSESIPTAKHSATHSKSILDSDEVKIPSWLEPLARNAAAASAASAAASTELPEIPAKDLFEQHEDAVEVDDLAVTEVTDIPEVATQPVGAPSFGTRLLASEGNVESVSSSGSRKILIGAVAAGLLLLAGGGAWYWRQQPAEYQPAITTQTASTGAPSGASAQVPSQGQVSAGSTVTPSGNYAAASTPEPMNTSSVVNAANSPVTDSNMNQRIATVDAAPMAAAAPRPKKPTLGSVNLSAPIMKSNASGQDHVEETLNLEASSQPAAGGLSSGLSVSNSKQPAAPKVVLPVGGDVRSARLISSVAPIFPAIAKAQRVGGDVKIDALVDASGQVSTMRVVSGPPLLQQSAMDALRRWKYEPAQLDGKAVPMHLTVTVQFKLQ